MADTVIGSYAIESLTRSMYEDSRCIYREFVQNAADQIDEARNLHLDPDDYYDIQITIDAENRRIIVEDNATGVSVNNVSSLRDVARSKKKRGKNKGFRGIGRLGALGYCSDLYFETSYKGEAQKTILHWDAKKLNELVDDETLDLDAGAVIDMSLNISSCAELADKHYFKVIMDNVTDDKLLDAAEISRYLSMVAPVDYPTSFSQFGHRIKAYMRENHLTLDTYNLLVNGDQIYKGYTTRILDSKNGDYDVSDIRFFEQKNDNGEFIYWGWYSVSELRGQIPSYNLPYGMRLRCQNIQLGDENTCKKFFSTDGDKRFALYFYGEVHVVAPELQPDGRRDYVREGEARHKFEELIMADFAKLKKLCYDAQHIRSSVTDVSKAVNGIKKIEEKKKNGSFNSPSERQKAEEDFAKYQQDLARASKKLQDNKQKHLESDSVLGFLFTAMGNNYPEVKGILESNGTQPVVTLTPTVETEKNESFLRTDKDIYSKFSKKEKNLINTVYDVVQTALPDEKARETLIARIEAALTKK